MINNEYIISDEARKFYDMLMSGKGKGPDPEAELTLEAAMAGRNMVDEMTKNYIVPDCIRIEQETAVPGEWMFYDEQDTQKDKGKILLFMHGGGFNCGTVFSRRNIACGILETAKADGFSVDYRQCPEYKYPAALEDGVAAYQMILERGYKPENIVVFGESAGTTLGLALILWLKDHDMQVPGGICVFSPCMDTTEEEHYDSRTSRKDREPMLRIARHGLADFYCEPEETRLPYVCPCFGDFSGFPKISIHVGTEEVLYDDAIILAEKCKAANVEVSLKIWDGLYHVFPLFPMPESEIALRLIGEFVRSI
jgi:monoterpene epsilon-lactone hydrolase